MAQLVGWQFWGFRDVDPSENLMKNTRPAGIGRPYPFPRVGGPRTLGGPGDNGKFPGPLKEPVPGHRGSYLGNTDGAINFFHSIWNNLLWGFFISTPDASISSIS